MTTREITNIIIFRLNLILYLSAISKDSLINFISIKENGSSLKVSLDLLTKDIMTNSKDDIKKLNHSLLKAK